LTNFDNEIEITLEANPTSVESVKFNLFRDIGINRLSLGVQSFNDKTLRFLGRQHSASEAMRAIEVTGKYFDNFSFDLIYALPGQNISEWERELEEALGIAQKHISLYQLTIEKGTKFYTECRNGKFNMPIAEIAADFYELTNNITERFGFIKYEVSNYAKKGYECKHNLNYWRYGDFIGVGPGAHGRYRNGSEKFATEMLRNPLEWFDEVMKKGVGLKQQYAIEKEGIYKEQIIMGLRLREGISMEKLNLSNCNLKLEELFQDELLVYENNKVRATEKGFLVLDSIILHLLS
jgi:putative oxygen-independent coproporphyrinogen III oxidase